MAIVHPTLVKAVVCVMMLACPIGHAQAQTPTDSAGVRIVEHASIGTTRIAFRIDSTPLVRLGGLRSDEREEFSTRHGLLGTLRLPDGRIVVNDHSELKVFDARGRLLRVIGRRGSGPGEFQQTRSVCLGAGDSLVALDFSLRRASVFTVDGAFVRTISVDATPVPLGEGCFSDGSLLMMGSPRVNERTLLPAERAKLLDRVADFRRVSMSARVVRTVGTWATAPMTAFLAPISTRVVRDRIYFGDSRDASVRIHDADGRLTHVFRWRAPRVNVTPELIERRVRASVPTDAPRSVVEERVQAFHAMPVQDVLPSYLRMFVDPIGRIWLEDYPVIQRGPGWTVLDQDGALLGRVEMPRIAGSSARHPGTIVEVLEDRVAMHWRDEDGAVHLGYFALRRSQ